MPLVRTILCPVDFSETSREALRWAAALALMEDARLILLTVVPPLLAEAARAKLGTDLVRDEVEPELRSFAASVLASPGAAEIRVIVGEPADGIAEVSEGNHGGTGARVDLIVIGTSGLDGMQKAILGSTAERVLRRSPVPVLTIPAEATDATTSEAGRPTVTISRVLAAVDFSETSAHAARVAGDYARLFNAPMVLAHVVAPQSLGERLRAIAEREQEDRAQQADEKARQLLSTINAPPDTRVLVVTGSPAEQIITLASEEGRTLVVLGLLSDTGVLGPRPGSIAYKVLTHARVPVLVVPPEAAAPVAR